MKNRLIELFNPKDIFKTRALVLMALMVALSTALSAVEVYLDPTQKLFSFAYLPRAMAAILFGPWAALAVAFVSDLTSFVASSSGFAYFPGYALSAMVADFLCALLLYKRELSFWRVAVWRGLVIVFVIFGLNSIWMIMFYGVEAGKYFSLFRVVRNLFQLPLDIYLVTKLGRDMRKFLAGGWK